MLRRALVVQNVWFWRKCWEFTLGAPVRKTPKGFSKVRNENLNRRNVSYNSVAKLAMKTYPDHQAVANAYRLCWMKAPVAKGVSPLAMLDLRFLRQLDDSGFINGLYDASER